MTYVDFTYSRHSTSADTRGTGVGAGASVALRLAEGVFEGFHAERLAALQSQLQTMNDLSQLESRTLMAASVFQCRIAEECGIDQSEVSHGETCLHWLSDGIERGLKHATISRYFQGFLAGRRKSHLPRLPESHFAECKRVVEYSRRKEAASPPPPYQTVVEMDDGRSMARWAAVAVRRRALVSVPFSAEQLRSARKGSPLADVACFMMCA